MAWTCPDCRYYTNHVSFVCPRCHLGALYDTRSGDELRREGYRRVSGIPDRPGGDAQTQAAPVRRTFLEDVMALCCAGWLLQTVGSALRWVLMVGALLLFFTQADVILPWLFRLATPIISAIIPIWLLWICLRGIFRP